MDEKNGIELNNRHNQNCIDDNTSNTKENGGSWYAIRFFGGGTERLTRFLDDAGIRSFVPMMYRYRSVDGGIRTKRVLAPAFAHLMFIRKDKPQKQMVATLRQYPNPIGIYRYPDSDKPCEISDSEMTEFRMVCDPALGCELEDAGELAEKLVGMPVTITKGPFKGIVGILTRKKTVKTKPDGSVIKSKDYYVVKSYSCVAVSIRVLHGMFEKIDGSEIK